MGRTLASLGVVVALALANGCARSGASARVADATATRPATTQAAAATKPARKYAEPIRRGVEFLVKNQQPEGYWGTGLETRGYEVYHMVPGTHDAQRVATTALCVMALREVGETEAHRKAVTWLVEHGQARRDHGMLLYNIWAHTYGLQALAREIQLPPEKHVQPVEKMRKAAQWHLDRLMRYEVFLGGWNYYDFESQTQRPSMQATSFGTASGLIALWEARRAGIEVPQKLIDRCVLRLEEMRLPNGAYLYGGDHRYVPRHQANMPRGSVGRTQACNDALWLWGSKKVPESAVRDGLEMFFREHIFIEMGRQRQYPHEAWYATAPYYYYYGHYYTGRLLERLGPEATKKYGDQLAEVVVPHQEPDGSWWDYAMWDYHKPYGTAFAVMTLLRCE